MNYAELAIVFYAAIAGFLRPGRHKFDSRGVARYEKETKWIAQRNSDECVQPVLILSKIGRLCRIRRKPFSPIKY
jgi:hypothetical protein